MRRLFVILVCALAVVPTAYAATRASGDGVLELRAVYGSVLIGTSLQPAQGALWGQMDKGTLRVTDPVAGDGRILVSGYERKWYPQIDSTGVQVVAYSGRDIHFRVTGGKYKLFFAGSGIDLTAVGVGVAWLSGDAGVADAGDYALNGGKWMPMPVPGPTTQQQFFRVPFGDQPSALNP